MQRRVLIVDDYPQAAEVLARLFERSGNQVRTALDGLAGVETAKQFLPDVMLVDIHLPKLDGYEVAQRIRQQPWGKRIVLIALTGWLSHEERAHAEEVGFNEIVLKPFRSAQLSVLMADS